MNNRLLIGALLFMVIAATAGGALLYSKSQPTEQETADKLAQDLFEMAMSVCTATGGTLVFTQWDETGRVIAANCVTIDDRTEEVAP